MDYLFQRVKNLDLAVFSPTKRAVLKNAICREIG